MPLLRNLPEDVLREESGSIIKKFVTAKKLLQADSTQFAPLTYQEAKTLKNRVARACAPFAQPALQVYKEFVRNASVMSTGIPDIDLLLSGGLSTGQITEVFGFSGTGKSEFCHRVAASVAHNLKKTVLYIQTKGDFCPEKIVSIVKNLDASLNEKALEETLKLVLVVSISSLDELLATLSACEKANPPQVVIVDSLAALVHPDLGAKLTPLIRLQTLAGTFQRLAVEHNLPVVIVNHQLDSSEDENGSAPRAAMGAAWQMVPNVRICLERQLNSWSATARTKRLNDIGVLNLNQSAVRASIRCQFCFNLWNEQSYRVRVKPKHKQSKNSRKILKRLQEDPSQLKPVEKQLSKKLLHSSNDLVLTCSVCKKASNFPLPIRTVLPTVAATPDVTASAKKRKRHRKDKMCGLVLPNNVESASPVPILDNSPVATPVSSKSKIISNQSPALSLGKMASNKKALSFTPVNLLTPKGNKKSKFNKDTLKKMFKTGAKSSIRDLLTSMPQ